MRVTAAPYPAGTLAKGCKKWRITVDAGTIYVDGKRKRSRWTEVFDGGRQKLDERIGEIARHHQRVAPDKMTVGEWLELWLSDYTDDLAPRTVYGYTRIVRNHLQPALGSIRLQELTAVQVRSFYAAQKRKGLSANTLMHHHRCLSAALAVAEEADYVDPNPMHKKKVIKAPKVPKTDKYVLSTAQERQRLVELARTWASSVPDRSGVRGRRERRMDLYVPVLLGLGMGLRAGEVCGLTWRDADLVDGVLTTAHSFDTTPGITATLKATKTQTVRSAKMPAIVVDALAQAKERREQQTGAEVSPDDPIVVVEFGRVCRPDRLSRQFRKMCDDNDLDSRLVFHGLRHTCASTQDSLGVPRGVTQSRMGHSSALMTAHYVHAFSADDAAAADLIDADLRGTSPGEE